MTIRTTLAALLAVLVLIPTLAPAQNLWPSSLRRTYMDECLKGCTANTAYTSIQRAECPPYCECKIREAQSFMDADQAQALADAYSASKPHPMKERYEGLNPVCAKRVFK